MGDSSRLHGGRCERAIAETAVNNSDTFKTAAHPILSKTAALQKTWAYMAHAMHRKYGRIGFIGDGCNWSPTERLCGPRPSRARGRLAAAVAWPAQDWGTLWVSNYRQEATSRKPESGTFFRPRNSVRRLHATLFSSALYRPKMYS